MAPAHEPLRSAATIEPQHSGADTVQQPNRSTPDNGIVPSARSAADCLSCRVTGTLACGACAAWLMTMNWLRVPPPTPAHRLAIGAGAGCFATMALWRAVTP